MKNILVIALARLGDLIQCFPAISDLRRLPDTKSVDVLVQKDLLPLAKMHPGIRRAIPFAGDELLAAINSETDWFDLGMPLVDELLSALEEQPPDVIVNLTHTPFSAKLCSALPAAEVRGRTYQPGAGIALPDVWSRYFFTLLESRAHNAFNLVDVHRDIASGKRGVVDKLMIPSSAKRFAVEKLAGLKGRRRIALGIGAHHPLRRWQIDLWLETALLIHNRGDVDVVLVGGESEREAAERITSALGNHGLNLCGQTDLPQLCAVLQRCDLFLGQDSGPLHLAALLKIPSVGLFLAMASAWETAPYVDGGVTIEPDISCYPCSENSACPDPQCHRVLSPEMVADTTLQTLRGEVSDLRSDCIIRITGFDQDYRLTLDGSRKPGDEQRLFWGSIMNAVLNADTNINKDNLTLYAYGNSQRDWEWKLQQFKHTVLMLVQKTLTGIHTTSKTVAPDDPLLEQQPALTAEYAMFRPLLDLYKVDCIVADGNNTSPFERILSAQDKLLKRIGIIEQVLAGDLQARITRAVNRFEKGAVESRTNWH